MEARVMAKQQF